MDLKRRATTIAAHYAKNEKIKAILLGGSVARNWHDAYSDIELYVFWKKAPQDMDRKSPIAEANGQILDYYPYEEKEWSETYLVKGIKFEMSHFLTDTLESIITDVTKKYDPDPIKQTIVAAVHDGIPLFGKPWIMELKRKTAIYPRNLSLAVIRKYGDLGNGWDNRRALLARRDWLMFYQLLITAQKHVMGMLFGLNRMYVHHPAFKWHKFSLKEMTLRPPAIVKRLHAVYFSPPEVALTEMENIVQDVFQIILDEFPEERFAFSRQNIKLKTPRKASETGSPSKRKSSSSFAGKRLPDQH